MAQLKKMAVIVAFLTAYGSYAFALAQQSLPTQGDQATDPRIEQAVDMIFGEMDTDHDSKISKSEWIFFHKQFKRLDKNGDGFITKDEVRADMKQKMK